MVHWRRAETWRFLGRTSLLDQLIDVVKLDLLFVAALLWRPIALKVLQGLVGWPKESQIAPFGQKDDLVAHHHVLGGVGDEDHRPPAIGQIAQQLHHLRLGARIQARGGLIEEKEARFGQQLNADGHPLALPATEGGHQVVPLAFQAQLAKDLHDALVAFLPGGVGWHPQLSRIVQGLVDRQLAVDDVLLRHIPHLAAVFIDVGIEVPPVDQNPRPRTVGGVETGQGVHKSGFAGAAGPHQGHKLLRIDRDGDTLEDIGLLTVPLFDAQGIKAEVARLVKVADAILLEDEAEGGDVDLVALFDPDLFLHPLAVDKGAVVAPQVAQAEASAKLLDDGVVAGHAGVPEYQDVAAVPSDGDTPPGLGQDSHIEILSLGCSSPYFHFGGQEADGGPVLEGDVLTDGQDIAVGKGVLGHLAALVGQAIGATQVHDPIGIALPLQAGVPA